MNKLRITCLALFLVLPNFILAQLGVMLNTEQALDGYTLFENTENTYLINNCGEILNIWPGVNQTDNHTKFLDNGNMLYIRNNAVFEMDWNGNIVNVASHGDPELLLEYEIVMTRDSNYICVARRPFSVADFLTIGYDIPGTNPTRYDVIVELDRNTGEIVWEWSIIDHVIQERDPSAPNYGIVSEHPELLNMDAVATFDWNFTESFMINSMDYNADLDLIIISVRKMNEAMIIDHSTTTEEAAGHNGGYHNKGGDILYRWGNPQNYGQGTENDRQLYFQHNPHWIKNGEYEGKIMIYNNGLGRPNVGFGENYSSIPVIDPPVDSEGRFILNQDSPFEPVIPEFQRDGDLPNGRFYSGYTSGASFLANGNLFITEGQNGRLLEIDPDGNLVWEYFVFMDDYIFRSEKYPKDHPAFEGRELNPIGTVESPSSSYPCELFTSTKELVNHQKLNVQVFQSPENSGLVHVINPDLLDLQYLIVSPLGQVLKTGTTQEYNLELNIASLLAGNYYLSLIDSKSNTRKVFKLIMI